MRFFRRFFWALVGVLLLLSLKAIAGATPVPTLGEYALALLALLALLLAGLAWRRFPRDSRMVPACVGILRE